MLRLQSCLWLLSSQLFLVAEVPLRKLLAGIHRQESERGKDGTALHTVAPTLMMGGKGELGNILKRFDEEYVMRSLKKNDDEG